MAKWWTDEETAAIERNYPKHGINVEKWDERPHRSLGAIRGRASRMGIKVDPESRKKRELFAKWDEHEVEVLMRNYPLYGTNVSFWDERISKSHANIWRRAQYMGLKASNLHPMLEYEDSLLLSKACRVIARKLGLTKSELVRELVVMERRGML